MSGYKQAMPGNKRGRWGNRREKWVLQIMVRDRGSCTRNDDRCLQYLGEDGEVGEVGEYFGDVGDICAGAEMCNN